MCGIFCFICKNESKIQRNAEFEYCREALVNRGPDGCNELRIDLTEEWYALFVGSVLWTQGSKMSVQPLFNKDVLLWNGDVFSGLDSKDKSDTDSLFSCLGTDCLKVLRNVCGPYAFIFWNSSEKRLYFGRDIIGRHSLLWEVSKTELLLTSVGNGMVDNLEEVPAYGIFFVELKNPEIEIELHPWSYSNEIYHDGLDLERKSWTIKNEIYHTVFGSTKEPFWLGKEPSEEDLKSYKGLNGKLSVNGILDYLLTREEIVVQVQHLKKLLSSSVKIHVETKTNHCQNCTTLGTTCEHPKLAILFSGGLDSSVLALMANEFVPWGEAIDLFNVAFEKTKGSGYEVPDRITGNKSLEELKRLCPDRKWNFIEIDISRRELEDIRKERIQHLIHPLKSILDDSLGCALWFAARGKGLLDHEEYVSSAKIVLSGMGADELFGGYSRHRRVYRQGGWPGLGRELERELKAIGRRNLARDNRVSADHGRQPRVPLLDEEVVAFARQLAPWQRCCLDFPQGIGDKLLLRLLARELGFGEVAAFPKRALQFGSRIANPKEKGHETSVRLGENVIQKI